MKRCRFIFLFLVLFCAFDANGAIVVGNYEAQFTVVPGESGRPEDVAVTLKITYDTTQRLANGFKFVGTDKVTQVSVRDEYGDISFKVEELSETKISFEFKPVMRGKKEITINFLIAGAVKEGLFSSQFHAQWLGNWNIPVDGIRYSFTLPDKYKPANIKTNLPYTTTTDPYGKEIIVIEQTPLKTRPLRLTFRPAISGHKLLFLIGWGVVSMFVVIVGVTKRLRLPQPPVLDAQQPTPAEIAYLKKGLKHAVCVDIFDLIQRRVLQQATERGHICQKIDDKEMNSISNVYEYGIVAFFRRPATLREFFAGSSATKAFKKDILKVLTRKGCLLSSYDKQSLLSAVIFVCILAVIALVAAGNHLGIDTAAIVLSLVVPVVFMVWVVVFLTSNVKSKRALKFLSDLDDAVKRDSLIFTSNSQYNPLLGYAVAIIGMSILVGTMHDSLLESVSYARAMHAGSSTACSACSAGSGGSSSSCSGCSSGGGDGGGGSGGCGGCGGGGGD
ncbi:MAG: TIGR04222 domain-containing membrane protein [Nitrospirae bacterium]|nr:TIGR04222 domain-containing membrane protein [Nitrospirota bacterium]